MLKRPIEGRQKSILRQGDKRLGNKSVQLRFIIYGLELARVRQGRQMRWQAAYIRGQRLTGKSSAGS